jgi:uncharacterized membrane protein (DUF4010 family)
MEINSLQIFEHYFLAILLGALLGLERERKEKHLAGLRTFILVTLFGSFCGQISGITSSHLVIFAGMIAITVQSAMVHFLRVREDIAAGLTTSVALLIAYGIGVLVSQGQTMAAVVLSLVTTVILYFKPQMHEFSLNLSKQDIYAIFQFGLIAFIILPILPDRGFGPYDSLNPYNIWLMVVMISAINLVGYVTMKFAGQRWSGPLLGILGGIASSTATTLSFSRHARENENFSIMGAVVVSLASTIVLIRMALLVGIIHTELLAELAQPLSSMFLCGLIPAFISWRRTSQQITPAPEAKNPMELKQALLFGLIYAVVLLAVSTGKDFFGNKGLYIVSLISGLTDVDAITLSSARLAGTGTLGANQAATSILIAYVANLMFKLAIVGVVGTGRMFRWTLLCFVCLALPAMLIFA